LKMAKAANSKIRHHAPIAGKNDGDDACCCGSGAGRGLIWAVFIKISSPLKWR
jgi:hypothetical protein